MSEMVERVARAIYFRGDDQGDTAWHHCQLWHRDVAREQARAAIEAMREPTEAMVKAAYGRERTGTERGNWRAMIDAALKEKQDG